MYALASTGSRISFPVARPFSKLTESLPKTTEEALIELILSERLPFTFVHAPTFKRFLDIYVAQAIKEKKPILLPNRNKLSHELLDETYKNKITCIRNMFADCGPLALTIDGTTNQHGKPFWSVTVHGISSQWTIIRHVIACLPVFAKHDAKEITSAVRKTLVAAGFGLERFTAVTTDEGGAAPCIAEELNLSTIFCSAHIIQTAQRNAWEEITKIEPFAAMVLSACKTLSSKMTQSLQASLSLKRMQLLFEEPTIKLPQEAPTRWNTILACVEAVFKCPKSICAWIQKDAPHDSDLNILLRLAKAWEIMEVIINVLTPLKNLTDTFSQDHKPTLHLVIAEYALTCNDLDHLLHQHALHKQIKLMTMMVEKIKHYLNEKLTNWADEELIAFALAPSNIKARAMADNSWNTWMDKSINLIKDFCANQVPSVTVTTQSNSTSEMSSLRSAFEQALAKPSPIQENPLIEVTVYLERAQSAAGDELEPLAFWKTNCAELKVLGSLAQKIFAIPCSQVTSEREFSLLRLFSTHLRGSLDPERMNKMVTCASFLRLRDQNLFDQTKATRSIINLEADSQRVLSSSITRNANIREQVEERFGPMSTWETPVVTFSHTIEESDMNIDPEDLAVEVGTGERSDDEDFLQPPRKKAKYDDIAQNSSSRISIRHHNKMRPHLELKRMPYSSTLILATWMFCPPLSLSKSKAMIQSALKECIDFLDVEIQEEDTMSAVVALNGNGISRWGSRGSALDELGNKIFIDE